MKFMLLIYNDDTLLDALPAGQADTMMRDCLAHADELRGSGRLIESQMLESAATAKSVRIRNGRTTMTDGPFAEAKEHVGGFTIVAADDLDGALRWGRRVAEITGLPVEVRPFHG
jgi:hypothetical protein